MLRTIRKTTIEDLPILLELYEGARLRMRDGGNPDQWGTTYPEKELLLEDIKSSNSYVVCDEGKIIGTFYFYLGVDPTYEYIEDGAWLNDCPYGTIHRIASDGISKGILSSVVEYCSTLCDNLRIDTHEKNLLMQHIVVKNGFKKCGIIFLENGDPRIAYQKVIK